ncbi:MAG TPA: AMP-binding protein [Aeromicrobium sp.]|nr:AMP-binding protein [Aeromicrobium sp.]
MTELEAWVRSGGEPLVMPTSGSTGAPKSAVLSHRAVLTSARASLDRLGGPGQWLLALPVSGIGGLQVLVRSILAGREPVVLADHDDLAAALAEFEAERRYASIVPTQLYRWAEQGELAALARFHAVLVGGAAADPELVTRARQEGVNIVRTYGMTETCGGCVYDGVPLDGVEVRVDDAGQVWLRGPVLFDGYVGQPHPAGSWFATSDRGEILPDGRLRVSGRIDDVVVSGGVNVPVSAVEGAIRGMPGVGDLAIVGVEDAEWGQRVVAAVVPTDGAHLTLADVRDWVEAAGLPRTWAPRQLLLVDELPLGATGKVDRVRLLGLARDPRV